MPLRNWSGWRILTLWVAWPVLCLLVGMALLLGPDAWRLPRAGEFHSDTVVSETTLARFGMLVLIVPAAVTFLWAVGRRQRPPDGPAA